MAALPLLNLLSEEKLPPVCGYQNSIRLVSSCTMDIQAIPIYLKLRCVAAQFVD
jgi:hypothetical protein